MFYCGQQGIDVSLRPIACMPQVCLNLLLFSDVKEFFLLCIPHSMSLHADKLSLSLTEKAILLP